MLQARAYQRDGEDDEEAGVMLDDYTVHLRKSFKCKVCLRYAMVWSSA
jgi:hypothetical protein